MYTLFLELALMACFEANSLAFLFSWITVPYD